MDGDFRIIRAETISDMAGSIGSEIKDSVIISGDWGAEYACGVVVIDHTLGKAEVHEKMRDVWIILSGNGWFIMGGELVDEKSSSPGEWNALTINGGENFYVKTGDLIDISPGVAHQISAQSSRLVALIVKVPV